MTLRIPNFRLFLCLSLIIFTVTPALSQGISVQLDGRTLQFDQPPAMIGGRLLVPLRGIFEALQADVVYDAPTRSIQATKGSRVVQLQLGSRTAIIDGRTLFLDVPADTIGGRTMVPLRFVSEALGADVKWEGATKTVRLSSSGGDGDTGSTPPPSGGDEQAVAPRIDQVIHNATRALQPGQTIDIVVYGEPGAQASFEILGATQQISLREVSAGKYQTRWTIPNGLVVNQGVLVAHLSKNGRETAAEAQRSITVSSSQAPTTDWNVSPADGTTVSDARPQVVLSFPQAVQPGSIRFYVDGVDFSNQVRLNGQRMTWQAGYDLSATQHQAEVQAVATDGQRLNHRWSFDISPDTSGGLQVQEVRPSQGSTAGPRDQIGVTMNQNVHSISMTVDTRQVDTLPGVQRYSNGINWTPTYDLDSGQHRAQVRAVGLNGQVVTREWTWNVGSGSAGSITNFTVTPNQVNPGQTVTVRAIAPSGGQGTFTVGQVRNLSLPEVSPGIYQGTYNTSPSDQGTSNVQAFVRYNNGQTISSQVRTLSFSNQTQLSVTNLSDGMTIPPVFNVQGRGVPGRTVSVTVEYSSGNILEAITGQLRTIRNQTVVGNNGFFDVPIDGSGIRQGQRFRVTVSDGQNQPIQMILTRQ